MQMMDCVEVIVEKESYAREGVHKGMQGWICYEQEVDGYWLVNFPQYGEKNDIAEIDIKEEDLKYLPNGMNVKRTEQIKAHFTYPAEVNSACAKVFECPHPIRTVYMRLADRGV